LAGETTTSSAPKAQIICPIIKAGGLAKDFTSVSGYGIIPECLLRALTWMLLFGLEYVAARSVGRYSLSAPVATVASATAARDVEPQPGGDSGMTPTAAISKASTAERHTAAASSAIGRGLPRLT